MTSNPWEQLPVSLQPEIIKTIRELGFEKPFPVQKSVLPLLLGRKDVAAEAVTGSGKTVAFLIPVLELLVRRQKSSAWKPHEIGALILSPTYELSLQIHEVLQEFLKNFVSINRKPLFTSLVLSGGGGGGAKTSRSDDLKQLTTQGATILVATPGRLVDLVQKAPLLGQISTNQSQNPLIRGLRTMEILIIDEADRLLDMGFEPQLNAILNMLPKQRRTGLFSATQTTQLDDLLRAGLRNPVRIVVREIDEPSLQLDQSEHQQRTPSSLENFYIVVKPEQKFQALIAFLRSHGNEKVLVFFATCAAVDYFTRLLQAGLLSNKQKQHVFGLHGRMRQKRGTEFAAFRKEERGVLLCTDVMARGIEIPNVHWVIQWDPPSNANFFVHRCGRTARCGALGRAVLFLTPEEVAYVDFLRINQSVTLTEQTLEDLVPAEILSNPDFNVKATREKCHKICLGDRLVYEKSIKAFVSFVQFYRKHECSLLFNVKDLDFGGLANAYGLLRLPQMPELKGTIVDSFVAPEVDLSLIKYKEKSVARQRELKKQAELENPRPKIIRTSAWSKTKVKKAKKAAKRAKRKMKALSRENEVTRAEVAQGRRPAPFLMGGQKRAADFEDADVDDINEEYRKIKKKKGRKVTVDELDDLADSAGE